ncbi:MAG: hypothetical protein KKD63_13985 [Proteobacteria bacterium]|nr:hypothetical protein [Desulfobulbaceae bacterium]MBU4153979.1 hypothetical protein [Pseudomonadota bacterium]MDP2107195.1 hypothetical protein [Desulfobulbaceae bacterium]
MNKRLRLKVVAMVAGSLLALAGASVPSAFAADQSGSGCVICHTDEAKLTASLAKVEVKSSAKQAGAG